LTVDTLEADRQRGALMAAAQAGDRSAYERLLRDCIPFIEMVARRQGVALDRVDDVVQETLLTIHRARQTYDPGRSFTAWLRTIAQRRAIDGLRRHGRTDVREIHAPLAYENYADPGDDIGERAERTDGAARVGRAIDTLPARQREAVQHIAVQGLSLREAASATGRTAGALKVNLHRALKTLRAHLGGEG
jgi:RNA polymerase sigma factor (sigma-70 family)